ncbi:MAG TPA: leucine-rich repeat domain-containing protein [Clostridia bacterium]|nr:leucine-rich repeat domain-containing protein [Clostridia bacterium]
MKKFPVLLFCAALVLTLMPVTARAASSVDTADYAFEAATGTLTIKSNAAIEWVGAYGDSHWCRDFNFFPDDIKAVDILNGVTEIGDQAFMYCTALASVTIPSSVTSIGDQAFMYCRALTSVTIPNSVTSISDGAFAACTALTLVTIPNSVTSIGEAAFSGCTALTSVTIPNSVTSISFAAFNSCIALTSVTIPNSVTSISDAAFLYCKALTSVTIPNSVTSIDGTAFADCTALTSVTIPNSVASIGEGAFFNCNKLTIVLTSAVPPAFGGDWAYSVAAVWYPAAWGAGAVTNYGGRLIPDPLETADYSFSAATGTLTIKSNAAMEVVSGMPGVSQHWQYDTNFSRADVIAVNILNGVTEIGNAAFNECTALTSATIPNSVISIGDRAFFECTALTSVTIPNSVTSIGDDAFAACTALTSVKIPNSVTSISDEAFAACTALTSVTIPNSVTSIGYAAFVECTALTSVTIPNSVTSIGPLAFANCRALTSVTIPNSVASIGDAAFAGCIALTSVTIPNSVASIGDAAFNSCIALTSVTIPNSAASIGDIAFAGCYSLTIVLTSAVPPTFGADWAIEVAAVCYPAAWGGPGSGLNLNYSGNAFAIIDAASISGVTAPVRGALPVSAITETAQYTGTLTWSPADDRFRSGTAYTAIIALTPKAGYTLTGVAENLFTVAGAATTNAANSGVVTAVFPAMSEAVQRTLTSSVQGISVSGLIHRSAELIVQNMVLHQEGICNACTAIRKAQSKGQLILGFDIDLTRDFSGPLTISIPIGNQHNGGTVTILHCVNGRLETLAATVADGKATFTVTSLSPFAVTTGLQDSMVSNPPNTGDAANPTGFVMLGLAALCSGYLVMKRRKA